jgi:hypothetical protein
MNLHSFVYLFFIGLLIGMAFMTNALDGPIYVGLVMFLLVFMPTHQKRFTAAWMKTQGVAILVLVGAWILGSLPFLLFFKSFVSGIAVNCPPAFLAERRLGPILFETIDKCQKSPLWMMGLLWGFFWVCGGVLLFHRLSFKLSRNEAWYRRFTIGFKHTKLELVLVGIFVYCVLLIIFPEFKHGVAPKMSGINVFEVQILGKNNKKYAVNKYSHKHQFKLCMLEPYGKSSVPCFISTQLE